MKYRCLYTLSDKPDHDEEMTEKRPQLNVRVAGSILRRIDVLIESGEYSDRTDFVTQALLYLLNREDIRRELRTDIINEVSKDAERRLYSDEYVQFVGELIHSTMTKIMEDQRKK